MSDTSRIEACEKKAVEADIMGEGVISSFDREQSTLYVSADFYAGERQRRIYRSREEISDPISALQWDLYAAYPEIACMAVVRSCYVLLWATLGRAIPPLNAFHAEHFYGEIPCTERDPMPFDDFETRQLELIREAIGHKDVEKVPAILLRSFGALIFADDMQRLCERIDRLEAVARIAWEVMMKEPRCPYLDYTLLNEYHYLRNGGARWMEELPDKPEA